MKVRVDDRDFSSLNLEPRSIQNDDAMIELRDAVGSPYANAESSSSYYRRSVLTAPVARC